MNNRQRFQQQNHQRFSNRSQDTQSRAPFSRREQLEREMQALEREVVVLDAQIDALNEKGRLLEVAKQDHLQRMPLAIAQVALSTLGVRYLPPVARTWHYKQQHYLQAEEQLKQYALSLYTKRHAITAQMEHIEIQIEMLQYQP